MLCRRSKWLFGDTEFAAVRIKGHRWVAGKMEYLIEWAPNDGETFEDTYEPPAFVSPDLKKSYSVAYHEDPIEVTIDVVPLVGMIRQSIARAVTIANIACRPRVHNIPVPELALAPIVRAVLSALAALGDSLSVAETTGDDGVTTLQLVVKKMADIANICEFGRFIGEGAVGALRYHIGRDSNWDMMAVGMPIVFTSSQTRAGGLWVSSVMFPTGHFNGATGKLRPPHMTKGLLKSTSNRDRLVQYVRSVLPSSHPLHAAGWCQLPVGQYEIDLAWLEEPAVEEHES